MNENKINIKKLCTAALLCAVGVVGSLVSIPVGASRCCPAQAAVNIVGGIILGPWYSLAVAFVTSLIRNLLGTGTLLAFPGSLFGSFLAGFLFNLFKSKNIKLAYVTAFLGELFGTGILGAISAYPIALYLMGKQGAVFGYVIPFLISSAGGAVVAAIVIVPLMKAVKKLKIA